MSWRITKSGRADKRFKMSKHDHQKMGEARFKGCVSNWIIAALFLVGIIWFSTPKPFETDETIVNGKEMIVTEELNLRQYPSSNGRKIKVLDKGLKVIASEVKHDGWVLIADADTNAIGYVYSKYLSLSK